MNSIIDEIVTGGLVLQTSVPDVLDCLGHQRKLERQENPLAAVRNDMFSDFTRP